MLEVLIFMDKFLMLLEVLTFVYEGTNRLSPLCIVVCSTRYNYRPCPYVQCNYFVLAKHKTM